MKKEEVIFENVVLVQLKITTKLCIGTNLITKNIIFLNTT